MKGLSLCRAGDNVLFFQLDCFTFFINLHDLHNLMNEIYVTLQKQPVENCPGSADRLL